MTDSPEFPAREPDDDLVGEAHVALADLAPKLYSQLHALAEAHLRNEPVGHTLQPTALVNEAFIKLENQNRVTWEGRTHFLAIASRIMRRVLVDHARGKGRLKRGAGRQRIAMDENLQLSRQRDEDLLALDEALHELEQVDTRQARIVELRFFGGLTVQEVAQQLGVSKRTIENEWTMVRAWLRRQLSEADPP